MAAGWCAPAAATAAEGGAPADHMATRQSQCTQIASPPADGCPMLFCQLMAKLLGEDLAALLQRTAAAAAAVDSNQAAIESLVAAGPMLQHFVAECHTVLLAVCNKEGQGPHDVEALNEALYDKFTTALSDKLYVRLRNIGVQLMKRLGGPAAEGNSTTAGSGASERGGTSSSGSSKEDLFNFNHLPKRDVHKVSCNHPFAEYWCPCTDQQLSQRHHMNGGGTPAAPALASHGHRLCLHPL